MASAKESAFSQADIDEMVARVREESKEERAKELDAIRAEYREALAAQVTAANAVPSPVAGHAGGPGTVVAETWSAYDQALAAKGEHPHQRGEHADWLAHPDKVDWAGNRQIRT